MTPIRCTLCEPVAGSFLESVMKRYGVNKSKSASKFKKHMSKTKAVNVKAAPMRGGIRL